MFRPLELRDRLARDQRLHEGLALAQAGLGDGNVRVEVRKHGLRIVSLCARRGDLAQDEHPAAPGLAHDLHRARGRVDVERARPDRDHDQVRRPDRRVDRPAGMRGSVDDDIVGPVLPGLLEMEDEGMGQKRHKPEEIVAKLRQVDVLVSQGRSVSEAVRSIGVTQFTYYRWRKEFGGLKTDQVKRLKELEKENERLRKAVSDLTLEKLILREAASGNF